MAKSLRARIRNTIRRKSEPGSKENPDLFRRINIPLEGLVELLARDVDAALVDTEMTFKRNYRASASMVHEVRNFLIPKGEQGSGDESDNEDTGDGEGNGEHAFPPDIDDAT
jgi:hypothetical protein